MESVKVSIMQWNTLCSKYSTKEAFPKVPDDQLVWENRYKLQRELIRRENPDIIAMEEVDNYAEFEPKVLPVKYASVFIEKPTGDMGICFAYKKLKFNLIKHSKEPLPEEGSKKASSQIFGVYHLEHKQSQKEIVVIAVHLKAKAEFETKRVAQIKAVIEYIESNNLNEKEVVLLGDFNTEPHMDTIKTVESCNCGFKSVFDYKNAKKDNYAEFTTMKQREKLYKRVIDYIWYFGDMSVQSCRVANVDIDNDIGLPNGVFPSDHLYLIAEMELV